LEEIHVLSLKKLSRLDNERLREWLRFINSEKREEFMDLTGIDPVFVKAVEVLETFSANDHNRMLYEARLKEWRDNKSRIEGALAEGIGIGIKKYRDEILDLIKKGYTLADIEKVLRG
jgi:hypothetical protein